LRGFRHFTRTALLALIASVGAWVLPAGAQAAPVNQAPPSITGTPQEGSTLTEDPGFWASQYPWTESSQWEQCTDRAGTSCTAIPNAPTTVGSQYTLGPGDVGKYIVVVETATS
jgi:hypothetical protein